MGRKGALRRDAASVGRVLGVERPQPDGVAGRAVRARRGEAARQRRAPASGSENGDGGAAGGSGASGGGERKRRAKRRRSGHPSRLAYVPHARTTCADPEGGLAERAEDRERAVHVAVGNDGDEPDAEVERPPHVGLGDLADLLDEAEERRDRPRAPRDVEVEAGRQDAARVGDEAAAGDVREACREALGDERLDGVEVRPVDAQQGVADRLAAERVGLVAGDEPVEEDLAGQRVAVRVQARRGQPEQHVARPDGRPVDDLAPLDDADDGAGDVVVARAVEVRHLGRLAADEGAAVGAARPARRPRRRRRARRRGACPSRSSRGRRAGGRPRRRCR